MFYDPVFFLGIYTAIKQRSTILFNDKICKDNITVDNESIEISTKTGETDKILDTHSEKYHVTEALTPLTVNDIENHVK